MTYHEIVLSAAAQLTAAGIEEAAWDAQYLLEEACHLTGTQYLCRRMQEIPQDELSRFQEMIAVRTARVPLQHITGKQEFMGYAFKVTPDVLIPRQDTEVLVEKTLEQLHEIEKERKYAGAGQKDHQKTQEENISVLDLCTGSGCIVISLAKLFPAGVYTGTDISAKALEVASGNAAENEAAVTFLQGDLFAACPPGVKYDVIVSNPPYIVTEVIAELQPEVKDHDPMLALDGGRDGLDFYRRIAGEAGMHLKENGRLLIEIGSDQGESVSGLLRENGFTDVKVTEDLAGRDRVVSGQFIRK